MHIYPPTISITPPTPHLPKQHTPFAETGTRWSSALELLLSKRVQQPKPTNGLTGATTCTGALATDPTCVWA